MKHIGIAAISAEGASLLYKTIVHESGRRFGPTFIQKFHSTLFHFQNIESVKSKTGWSFGRNFCWNQQIS